ncbi:MAG TPA: hypothetical protein ENJ66_00705 [Calditrichae bacterium]|nr:hypothetical protein [Calditrichia bacterium]
MLTKLSKHRDFEYTPLYYKPEKDKDEQVRKRLGIRRLRHKHKTRSLIWMLATLGFILYMLYLLSQIGK